MSTDELRGGAPVAADAARRAPRTDGAAPVRSATPIILAATLLTALTVALTAFAAYLTIMVADTGIWKVVLGGATLVVVVLALVITRPLARGVRAQRAGTSALAAGDIVDARTFRHRAAQAGWIAMGACLPLVFVAIFTLFLLANDHAVQTTFFDVDFMAQSFGDVAIAFGQNVQIAILAEILVLVWGLLIAMARLLPGVAGRPIRWLATAYVDIFRAVPSIIVIYLVGFGLPLAGVPVLSEMSPMWAAVLALTLTYGAYVAEVYRAGIEGIHWSQVSAARSLGLSYGKTMRFVVVPQAVRRVTPPLLNDFIGLQKDTALVTVIGTVDAFTQAKIYASNYFNLSSVTVVAILFIIITIPQTRFVDRLLERDARRQRNKG
ncbi:amino acid ABC transporter permease [Microbacterium sp. 179-I 3D3 NHS]|uniref:amino acid ABC transporter permease n=1 Tax=Microbacterium sp. 179-I 3D3 NHS TaxID=3142382 RepID=UPI0039A331CF